MPILVEDSDGNVYSVGVLKFAGGLTVDDIGDGIIQIGGTVSGGPPPTTLPPPTTIPPTYPPTPTISPPTSPTEGPCNNCDEGPCTNCDEGPCARCDEGDCTNRDEGECNLCDEGGCTTCDEGRCIACDEGDCTSCDEGGCVGCDEGSCINCDEGNCTYLDAGPCNLCDQGGGCWTCDEPGETTTTPPPKPPTTTHCPAGDWCEANCSETYFAYVYVSCGEPPGPIYDDTAVLEYSGMEVCTWMCDESFVIFELYCSAGAWYLFADHANGACEWERPAYSDCPPGTYTLEFEMEGCTCSETVVVYS